MSDAKNDQGTPNILIQKIYPYEDRVVFEFLQPGEIVIPVYILESCMLGSSTEIIRLAWNELHQPLRNWGKAADYKGEHPAQWLRLDPPPESRR